MNIKKIALWSSIVTLVIVILPSALYYLNFRKFKLSDNPADWGTFGDYIGGVIGTCFSLLATILALVSIYISLKISEKVQENEIKFNNDIAKRETEKFEREVEMLHKQHKPFPYPNFCKYPESTSISIENHGAGPMIVKNLKIIYKDESYSNFRDLLTTKCKTISKELCYFYNSAPTHILTPSSSKSLLELKPRIEITTEFTEAQSIVREFLKDCILTFDYEDIFENSKMYSVNLKFFKS